MADNSGISFEINAKIDKALKQLDELGASIDKIGKEADKAGDEIDDAFDGSSKVIDKTDKAAAGLSTTFQKLGTVASGVFTAQQFAQYAKAIIDVRANIESLQVSFRTLLGDEQKAAELFGQIKDYAVSTPMQMADLADGAKTMLGFGIETEKVMGYLKQLGDISMGDSQKFQSLTLAFSQATSAGKLQGQDLLQLINAGFNPLNEIAKKTGKSIGELKDDMSKGAISAQDLADALASATGEGGMFHNALLDQSQTINGALSNLKGAWDDMLNDMGEGSQDVFVGIVSNITEALKHYRSYLSVIASLASAYGTYKAALMAYTVAQNAATIAQNAFNVAAKANPYVLIISAVVGLGTALYTLTDRLDESTQEAERHKKAINDAASAERQLNNEAENNIKIATDANKKSIERIDALNALKQAYPSIFAKYDEETIKLASIRDLLVEINKENANRHREVLTTEVYAAGVSYEDAKANYDKVKAEADKDKKNRDAKGYSKYYKSIVKSAKDAMDEAYKQTLKAQQDLVDYDKTLNAANKADEKQSKIQNKSYWEKKKEEAQNALDAMDASLKGTKDWKDKEKEIAEAQKEIDKYSLNKVHSNANKADKEAARQAKKNAKAEEEAAKQIQEAAKKKLQMQFDTEQLGIDQLDESGEKRLRQIDLNYRKEKAAIKQYEDELREQKYQDDKKLWEANNDGVFSGKRTDAKYGLTDDEKKYIEERAKKNEKTKQDEIDKEKELQAQAQREYLEQYGSYQAKRLAIAEKYARLIKEAADDEYKKKSLQKQLEAELSELDFSNIQKKLNWSGIFGNLSSKTKGELSAMKTELSKVLQSGQFDKDIDKLKILYERLTAIDEQLIGKNGAFNGLGIALDELAASQLQLNQAEKALTVARITGDDATIKAAEDELELAHARNNAAKESVNIAKKSTADFISNLNNLATSIGSAATGGSWSGIFSGLSNLAPTFDSIFKTNVTDAFNALGDEMVSEIDNIVSNIGTIIQSLKTTDITEQQKANILLSNIISSIDTVIKGIADNKLTVEESLAKYNEAKALAEKADADAMEDLRYAWGKSGVAVNSYNAKVNEIGGFSWNDITDYINNILKVSGNYTTLTDVAENLSTTQLKNLLDTFPQLKTAIDVYTEHLKNDTGYFWESSPSEIRNGAEGALNKALDLVGKVEAATTELNLALTGVTFDSIESKFKDTLSNMTADASSFSDDLEENLRTAIVNSVFKNYDAELSEWYSKLAEAMQDGLTAEEASDLRAAYTDIANRAKSSRDAALAAVGLDSESSKISATQKSVASMSEDTATELNGRFTALQIAGNSIDKNLQNLALDIKANAKETHRYLKELVEGTDDVADNTGGTKEVKARLDIDKLDADIDTSGLQSSIDGLSASVKGLSNINVKAETETPKVDVKVEAPQVNVETDNEEANNIIQQVNAALASVVSGNTANASLLTSLNSTMMSAVSAIVGVQTAVNDSNSLLANINASVLACNGTLNAIYNTNDSGFRSLQNKLDAVVSAINNKM